MGSIINKLLTLTPLGKFLNGKKTIIGAALIVLAHAFFGLVDLAALYPTTLWFVTAYSQIGQVLVEAAGWLDYLGVPALTVGVVGKVVKWLEARKG